MNKPTHLRDRKLKTCKKLVCVETTGDAGSEGTEDITFHQCISSKD